MFIIAKSPYRISFFGGGTDYHTWYEAYGGEILSTTINHYCNIVIRKFPECFENKYRVAWKILENKNTANEIEHPFVREAIQHYKFDKGLSVLHEGDLPAKSGLGSSSAFACAFIKGIHALQGKEIGKKDLAKEAIFVERSVLKENVGIQDQIAASYGGFNHISIDKKGDFDVKNVILEKEILHDLQKHLVLFFTNTTRLASQIASAQMKASKDKVNELSTMQDMVKDGMNKLSSNDFIGFGKLLHESWLLKRSLTNKISNPLIDEIYTAAIDSGAIGGKLLGAGGGGCILFVVEPNNRQRLLDALQKLIYIDFQFETKGTHIISCS